MQHVRPLPGITFRTEPPSVVSLPRMDVAAFVGFAQSGPINIPVAVEDYPRFEDIFGGTYRLAWDDETANWQTACLAPAVKDFFAQGGRRCWIVRVANSAVVNHFPIAGLLQTTATGGYASVLATARSAGSWSDDVQIGAGILSDFVQVQAREIQPGRTMNLSAVHLRGQPLVAGELLQLDFSDEIHRAYVALHTDELVVGDDSVQISASIQQIHWFRRIKAQAGVPIVVLEGNVHTVAPTKSANITGKFNITEMRVQIDNALPIEAGDWVTFKTPNQTIWMYVAQVSSNELSIRSAWCEGYDTSVSPLTIARALRVRMALQVHENIDQYRTLSDIAFSAPHPRFVGYLPDDNTLYDPSFGKPLSILDNPQQGLWNEVQNPRFSVHLPLDEETFLLPLGLESAPIWREAIPADGEPLVRDGLVPDVKDLAVIEGNVWSQFWQTLFLDPRLRYTGQRSLIAEANDLLYFQGKDLLGLHALFPIEEVSMVALPDVNHRGWFLTQREQVEIEEPRILEPEDPCANEDSPFIPCPPDLPLSWRLFSWQTFDSSIGKMERADDIVNTQLLPAYDSPADFINTLAQDTDTQIQSLVRQLPLDVWLYLGSHSQQGLETTENDFWENLSGLSLHLMNRDYLSELPTQVVQRINALQEEGGDELVRYWKLAHPLEYVSDGLLDVQTQLAKLAAVRGDFVTMLTLPKFYRTPDALEHQRDLYIALRRADDSTPSYVALYHPWIIRRDDSGDLLHVSPGGAACGVMAKRSLERGAWVAPSNVTLSGVLSLSPIFSNDDEISLYNAGINLVQDQARDFVLWGANTQTLDPEFMALNVRRLMILLRRVALIEGQSYVFAPHSPAFRRRVKQIFERRLSLLFERGAFAGRDPLQAYQVVIDETLNTQASIEQGRLIIELRVAPSRPITFITVRLIQTASGLLTVQEVVTNG